MNLTPFMFVSCLLTNPILTLCQLCQGRERIEIIRHICIIDSTIMLRHGERAVSQELLEDQSIAAAVHQKLSGKGMSEQVDARSAHTTLMIVFLDGTGERVLRHHLTIDRTEQIIIRFAAANAHVFGQDLCHLTAQRNGLQLACFGMTIDHTPISQRNIPVLNVADGSCPTTRID